MPNNLLDPKNLRWLTVYLFLGLMVLLLALNLFVPGASANNNTTPQTDFVNCQQVLHLTCVQVISTATTKATKRVRPTPTLPPAHTPMPTPSSTHTPTPSPTHTSAPTPSPTHTPGAN